MEVSDFISGTELMKLCDLCVFESTQNMNWFKSCKYIYNIDKQPTEEDIKIIKNAKKIFIKRLHNGSDFVIIFLNKFYNILLNDIIIITHCSDYGVYEKNIQILTLPKIKKWYGMNCYIRHPKLIPVPIGMTTYDKKHGNMKLLEKVINRTTSKTNLLYVNCDVRSNRNKRVPLMELMRRKGYKVIVGEKSLDQEIYWTELAQSKFIISPPGNGVDCHRIWESIYLGTIPIVERNIVLEPFTHLPILFIDDWNVINNEFLERKWEEFSQKTFDTRMCYMKYWAENIKG